MPNGSNRTYVENVKDSDKVLLPTGDLILVALREDESEERVSFTLLDDLPLDPSQGTTINTSVSELLGEHTMGMAYVVRIPIASRTDWLSSSALLPFNLW